MNSSDEMYHVGQVCEVRLVEMIDAQKHLDEQFRNVKAAEMAMAIQQEDPDHGNHEGDLLEDDLLQVGGGTGRPDNVESPDPSNVFMVRWSYTCVKLLMVLYKENEDKFTSINYKNKQVWQIISSAMQERGHNFTGEQCDAKWRSLKKVYKKIKHSNRKPLTGKRKWEYFTEMDDILGEGTSSTFETQLSTMSDDRTQGRLDGATNGNDSSNPGSLAASGEADEEISNRTATPPITGSLQSVINTSLKSKRNFDEEPDWFRTYRRERQRRHEDMMAFRKTKEQNKQTFRKTLLELLSRLSKD